MRYPVFTVAEVDVNPVDAVSVDDDKILVAGSGVHASIINVSELHTKS
jgi:hypothetical protein